MTTVHSAFGHDFDSALERDRYLELRALQDAGEISWLEPHPGPYTLVEGFRDEWGHVWRPVRYTADFGYIDRDGVQVIEEVKPTNRKAASWGREVTLKLKLLALAYPEWRVRVWTPDDRRKAA